MGSKKRNKPSTRIKKGNTMAINTRPPTTLEQVLTPNHELGPPAYDNDYGSPVMNNGLPKRVVDMLGNPLKPKHDPTPPPIVVPKQRVALMRDHTLDYPDLLLEVWVTGPDMDRRGFAKMFARAGCKAAASLDTADLVVFTGGADVDPALYGATRHSTTHFDVARDNCEITDYLECYEKGIPMLGICRGAQFLHVMNGGKLYQDLGEHYGPHSMWDVRGRAIIEKVSSVHHQACIQNVLGGMEVLATHASTTTRWEDPETCVGGTASDVEAYFYRDTCCIGIQGHPEYEGYNFFTKWSLDLINDLVIMNPDIDWVTNPETKKCSRRIRDDILALRPGAASITKPTLEVMVKETK